LRIFRTEAALAAALLVAGCAGAEASLRQDVDALRAELAVARQENQELQRKVEALAARMDLVTARLTRPAEGGASAVAVAQAPAAAPVVPGGLAVVRVEPPGRRAPPVPVAVPIVEPDGSRLEALARRSGRELAAEAEAELKAARRRDGLARAHGLEDFVTRYPHHPQADNALVEASGAYADAGRVEAACTVARRAVEEYPAGDAVSEALWRVAACESQRGGADAEKKILSRLVSEFPSTPAARRAGARLAAISGRTGVDSPAAVPARSGP
jgi:TolA-binding protein